MKYLKQELLTWKRSRKRKYTVGILTPQGQALLITVALRLDEKAVTMVLPTLCCLAVIRDSNAVHPLHHNHSSLSNPGGFVTLNLILLLSKIKLIYYLSHLHLIWEEQNKLTLVITLLSGHQCPHPLPVQHPHLVHLLLSWHLTNQYLDHHQHTPAGTDTKTSRMIPTFLR